MAINARIRIIIKILGFPKLLRINDSMQRIGIAQMMIPMMETVHMRVVIMMVDTVHMRVVIPMVDTVHKWMKEATVVTIPMQVMENRKLMPRVAIYCKEHLQSIRN